MRTNYPAFESSSVTWEWGWAPAPDHDLELRVDWAEQTSALFADWTREGLIAAKETWTGLSGESEADFPVADEALGRSVAAWLQERADDLPSWCRLAWGAALVDERPRWAPVPVVVEFREPRAVESHYLMEDVGARGLPGDGREPVIDYVSTPSGDGVRVTALVRGEHGEVGGRLDAAMRIDIPPAHGAAVSADVLFATRVFDLGLLGVIGAGVEQLMLLVATDCVPESGAGTPGLVLVPTEGSLL